MTSELRVFYRVLPDETPDTSYLEQPGFEDRLGQYRQDLFGFVGVRAVVELRDDTSGVTTTVESAGLWGIESDSGDEYFREIGAEELGELSNTLSAHNISIDGVEPRIQWQQG